MPRKDIVNVYSKKDIQKTIKDNNNIKLTVRQELFATEYARNNGNGMQATKYAGYKGTDKVLSITAARLLGNDRVKARIEQEKARITAAASCHLPTDEEIIAGIAAIANNTEAKDADRLKAWELLGRNKSLFNDKLTVQNNTDYANIISNSRKQLESILEKSTDEGHETKKA